MLQCSPSPLGNNLDLTGLGEMTPATEMRALDMTADVDQSYPCRRLVLVQPGQSDEKGIGTIIADKHGADRHVSLGGRNRQLLIER